MNLCCIRDCILHGMVHQSGCTSYSLCMSVSVGYIMLHFTFQQTYIQSTYAAGCFTEKKKVYIPGSRVQRQHPSWEFNLQPPKSYKPCSLTIALRSPPPPKLPFCISLFEAPGYCALIMLLETLFSHGIIINTPFYSIVFHSFHSHSGACTLLDMVPVLPVFTGLWHLKQVWNDKDGNLAYEWIFFFFFKRSLWLLLSSFTSFSSQRDCVFQNHKDPTSCKMAAAPAEITCINEANVAYYTFYRPLFCLKDSHVWICIDLFHCFSLAWAAGELVAMVFPV